MEERREEGRFDELFLQDYLQDVALLTDADSDGDKDEPRVSLMTVHAAKGLEFPTVFVVGLKRISSRVRFLLLRSENWRKNGDCFM